MFPVIFFGTNLYCLLAEAQDHKQLAQGRYAAVPDQELNS